MVGGEEEVDIKLTTTIRLLWGGALDLKNFAPPALCLLLFSTAATSNKQDGRALHVSCAALY
jgi:hypothetical protein